MKQLRSLVVLALICLSATPCIKPSQSSKTVSQLILYDDYYLESQLDDRYPYLKLGNGSYLGPRDYFKLDHVFQRNQSHLEHYNVEEHIYDELRAMELCASISTMDQWHYSDPELERKSGWPEADSVTCARDLASLEDELVNRDTNSSSESEQWSHLFTKGTRNVQLLRYLDAWGRPPSETYYGHSYWVGSYRACKRAQVNLSAKHDNKVLKFDNYCWAKLRAKSWPEKDELVPATSIRVGVCLPRSCDTRAANENTDTIKRIMHLNFAQLYRERFNKIIGIYCLPVENDPDAYWSLKVFCIVVGVWLAIVLSATLAACLLGRQSLWPRIRYLSLQENFERFSSDDPPPPPASLGGSGEIAKLKKRTGNVVDLRPLSLVRLAASFSILFAHAGCVMCWIFNTSTFSIITSYDYDYLFMVSCIKALDLFMVLSGVLTGYITLNKIRGHDPRALLKPLVYLGFQLARFLRLAPMLVFTVAFMKAVFPHMSEGPLWDYGTFKYSLMGQCRESSWWRALVFPIIFWITGNSYYNECLVVSWYTVADMKLALMAPVLLYLMAKSSPKKGLLVVISAMLFSGANHYYALLAQKIMYLQQYFTWGQLYGASLTMNFVEYGYFSAIYRLHSFTVGLFAGLQLRRYSRCWQDTKNKKDESCNNKSRDGEDAKWPSWMYGFPFWLACAYEVADFFGPHLAQYNYLSSGYVPSEDTIRLMMVVKPRLDAIVYAIILLRLVTDLAPRLMKNTLPLYKLGKLSYCIYLWHAIFLAYVASAWERGRADFFYIQMLMITAYTIVATLMISFPLYLLVESPIALLLSHQLKRPEKTKL